MSDQKVVMVVGMYVAESICTKIFVAIAENLRGYGNKIPSFEVRGIFDVFFFRLLVVSDIFEFGMMLKVEHTYRKLFQFVRKKYGDMCLLANF